MTPARRASSLPRERESGVVETKATGSPRSRGRRPTKRAAGFSLLEVLVAFVILSLVVTALFGLFGGALRNASTAADWSRALLVAQSRLAEAASVQPLKEGSAAGTEEDGRISWQTTVAPYVVPDPNPDLERASESMATRLYRVSVEVRYTGDNGKARTYSLSTVKVGAKSLQ
jgi:general secretion pathway protein I